MYLWIESTIELQRKSKFYIFDIQICSLFLRSNQFCIKQLHIKLMKRLQDENKHNVYGEYFTLILYLLRPHTYLTFISACSLFLELLKFIALKKPTWFFFSSEIIWLVYTTEIENHYKNIALVCLNTTLISCQLSVIIFKYIPLLFGIRWKKIIHRPMTYIICHLQTTA